MTMSNERRTDILGELLSISKKQTEYSDLLAQVQQQAQAIKDELDNLNSRQRDLGTELAGGDLRSSKPRRKYLSGEDKVELHRVIHSAMRGLAYRSMIDMPMEIVIRAVMAGLPSDTEIDEKTVERQVKALAADDKSPVQHNGLRGRGSLYRIVEE